MKRVLLAMLFAAPVAADVQLAWDPVPDSLGSYPVYCYPTPIPATPPYTPMAEVAHPTTTVLLDNTSHIPVDTEYECWVTNANSDRSLESGHSNHLRFTDPGPYTVIIIPSAPSSFSMELHQ